MNCSRGKSTPLIVPTMLSPFGVEFPLPITPLNTKENNASAIIIIRNIPCFLISFKIAICNYIFPFLFILLFEKG